MDEKVRTGQKREESKQVFFFKQKTRNVINKRLN